MVSTCSQPPRTSLGRARHPLIAGLQEADQRQQQHRRVELVAAERAGVGAAALAPGLRLDLGADVIARLRPARGVGVRAESVRELDSAIERDPAHHRRDRVAPVAVAALLDAGVGFAPLLGGPVDELAEEACGVVVELEVVAERERHVEHLAQRVELALLPGGVADPHRP